MRRSPKLEEIRKRISLETSLRVMFQMSDYNNWHNGEYFGNMDKINKAIELVLIEVEDWYNNSDRIIYDKNSRFKKA